MNRSELTEANIESGREVAPSGWRPIDTAPRDGTEIIVCGPYDEPCVVSWSGRNWVGSFQGQASIESQGDMWTDYHMAQVAEKLVWRPMPTPPPMADGDFLPDGASSRHTETADDASGMNSNPSQGPSQ